MTFNPFVTTEKDGQIGLHVSDYEGFHFRVQVSEVVARQFAAEILKAVDNLPRVAIAADFGMQDAA